MARKTHDIAVKTGEYTNSSGETKGRWQNVGALMQADDGGQFIILQRWFNPAGVPNPENRDNVMLSCFVPQGRDNASQGGGNQSREPDTRQDDRGGQRGGRGPDGFEDSEIPFSPEWRV